MVKSPRNYTIIFFAAITLIVTIVSFSRPQRPQLIDNFYSKLIAEVKKSVTQMEVAGKRKASLTLLKKQFLATRISYKKLAVLTEYFNAYETRLLNGPALDWSEENTPDVINPPLGLQVIEQLLYETPGNTILYNRLDVLLKEMQATLGKLESEPDRQSKFSDELVWDALRSAVLRLVTLGITGFDSPVAKLSLIEGIASLEGIKNILPFFKEKFGNSPAFAKLGTQLSAASLYLKTHADFDKFDRLSFIILFADPLYKQINELRSQGNIGIPPGSNPVNFETTSIFDEKAFSIDFFSPASDYWITPARVELGRRLFYDTLLSGSSTRSCASCHQPEKAFADGLKTSYAIDNRTPLLRNTPTLLNSAYQVRQFYDSRTGLLENQLSDVVHNEKEMKGSLKEGLERIEKLPVYVDLFNKAYTAEPKPLTVFTIGNAISSYVRSLSAFNSRFDQYMRGDKIKLNTAEKNGFNLFAGKGKCATCHYIPLFNGLAPPHFNESESEVLGVPADNSKTNTSLDADLGKFNYTRSPIHKHSFKTPILRNIELTAPYMHNGVYQTLEEVMEFYNNGGGAGLGLKIPNQTLSAEKLKLTKKEIDDIIAFMKTLTDTTTGYSSGKK
jgi:cytochrome c peroxidase